MGVRGGKGVGGRAERGTDNGSGADSGSRLLTRYPLARHNPVAHRNLFLNTVPLGPVPLSDPVSRFLTPAEMSGRTGSPDSPTRTAQTLSISSTMHLKRTLLKGFEAPPER